jgi:hypothetical protein
LVLLSFFATFKSRENHGERGAAEQQATSIESKEWKLFWNPLMSGRAQHPRWFAARSVFGFVLGFASGWLAGEGSSKKDQLYDG